jgi:transketolase|tara:strand:- start:56 stop:853 length:798 start_codon:yes stop_codon:yes gene_type:complete
LNIISENKFKNTANNIRKRIVQIGLTSDYKVVHYGGALSIVEIITYAYLCYLRLKPHDFNNLKRDRFVLSKGHACLAQYATLIELGFVDENDMVFEKNGSSFAGHPVINRQKFIDFSTGSLGNGLAYAIGSAISDKNRRVCCVIGDGELAEGSIWESLRLIINFNLKNLLTFIDLNGFQQTGSTKEINGEIDLYKVLSGFGFNVIKTNGHNVEGFLDLNERHLKLSKPTIIIAVTIKGFGIKSIENTLESHHTILKNPIEIFKHA